MRAHERLGSRRRRLRHGHPERVFLINGNHVFGVEPNEGIVEEIFGEHQEGDRVRIEYDTKVYYGQL